MEKKSSIIKPFGGVNVLDKKVKKNPKYDHVKSSIQQGKTMKDVEIMSDQLVAKRKSEKFKRIKCSTLAKLLQENNNDESVYALAEQHDQMSQLDSRSQMQSSGAARGGAGAAQDHDDARSVMTSHTGVSVGGVSQVSAVTYATEMLGITQNTKFLLLDMRDPEEYELYHIKEAVSYPAPNIGRDKIIPDLFRFKNQPDKLIIIYLSDERKGTTVAQVFFEKGYENVYLLSGGIESFLEEFHEHVEGRSVPTTKKEESKRSMDITKKKHEHCKDSPTRRQY